MFRFDIMNLKIIIQDIYISVIYIKSYILITLVLSELLKNFVFQNDQIMERKKHSS